MVQGASEPLLNTVKLTVIALHCELSPTAVFRVSFVCVCVCVFRVYFVCVCVSIAETVVLCSFIVVCSVVCPLRPATWYPVVSHNSYHFNYRRI